MNQIRAILDALGGYKNKAFQKELRRLFIKSEAKHLNITHEENIGIKKNIKCNCHIEDPDQELAIYTK